MPDEAAAPAPRPEPSRPRRRTVSIEQVEEGPASPIESYFDSPEYQRDYERSFIAQGLTEPPLSEDEIEALPEIYELIQNDRKERAFTRIKRELEDEPTANYWHLSAQILVGWERFEEAAAAYENAVELFPDFVSAWKNKALIHLRLTTTNRFTGNDAQDVRTLADEYEQEQYEKAATAFREALRLGAVDEKTYGFYGLTQTYFEQFMKAEMAYRNALMLSAAGSDLELQWKTGLAQTLLRQRRYADAAALVGELLEDDDANPDLWMLQGNAYLGLGNTNDAAQNFQIADELGGASAPALNLLADIFTNDQLSELAVETYLRAFEKGSTSARRALRGARLMVRRGEIEEVEALLGGIDERLGDSIGVEDRAELLKLQAQIAVRKGDAKSNIEILEQIIEGNPLDGDAFILLGQALGGQAREMEPGPEAERKFAEAEQAFETAAALDGFEAEAKLEHARLLVGGQKRYAEAIPLLKASLQVKDREYVREYLEGVEKAAKRSEN